MIPTNETEYQRLVESGKQLTGKLLGDYALIFDDEAIEIIPEFDEAGESTGFVTAQTWGTWNPQEVDRICIDNVVGMEIVPTWKKTNG